MKVLIIDDSPDALALAKARLASEGLDILCAGGAIEGLATVERERPDLILLDVDMPDMSGFDVCRQLKESVELCMIPIVFLSGSDNAEDKAKGLDLGGMDYVTKPFDSFELRARVRAALRMKRLQDMLVEYAMVDPLTGLPNRRALMERLALEWARVQRRGEPLSVVMADIDHFKNVNDTYGHAVGDEVLRQVAGAIASQCRETDMPARYGGEEFLIVVPGELASSATSLAERCRKAVEESNLTIGSQVITQTATFGVADTTNASSIELLINAADEALYRGKTSGRNIVVVALEAQVSVVETPP